MYIDTTTGLLMAGQAAGEATASKSGNVVTIPKGYHQAQTLTVGTAKEAETVIPGAEDIVIPADTYLAGDLTIQAVGESGGTGDSNIAYGVLDADGNFQALDLSGENPVDSGTAESISTLVMYQTGHDEPAYPSGGGGMDFYECSTVADSVWTGKKATQTANGVWSIADEETANLSIVGYFPKVGSIYSADTTLEIRRAFDGSTILIPQDGLVFYAPLQSDYIDVVSKSNATTTAGEFGEYKGKKALRFDGTKQWVYYGSNCDYPDSNIWSMGVVYAPLTSMSGWWILTRILGDSCWYINCVGSSLLPNDSAGSVTYQKWQSCFITYNNGVYNAYVDGLLTVTSEKSIPDVLAGGLVINAGAADGGSTEDYLDGYISDVAVYDRELSPTEVLEIHKTLMEGVTQ